MSFRSAVTNCIAVSKKRPVSGSSEADDDELSAVPKRWCILSKLPMIGWLLEHAYRSPLGRVLSFGARCVARLHQPFMVYGFRDPSSGEFRKYTRVSSNVVIMSRQNLSVEDQVWVWHHSILDATTGLRIGKGAQIGAWVGIFTHGSEKAIRLLGPRFVDIPNAEREGYTRGAVEIGEYTFIGAGSVILPGVTIGKGCLVATGALIVRDVPDYSIVAGRPGKIVGSTLDMDRPLIEELGCEDTYYDQEALKQMVERAKQRV